MKNLPALCAIAGIILLVLAIFLRVPGGLQTTGRGVLTFAQTILLIGIAVGVAELVKKKA